MNRMTGTGGWWSNQQDQHNILCARASSPARQVEGYLLFKNCLQAYTKRDQVAPNAIYHQTEMLQLQQQTWHWSRCMLTVLYSCVELDTWCWRLITFTSTRRWSDMNMSALKSMIFQRRLLLNTVLWKGIKWWACVCWDPKGDIWVTTGRNISTRIAGKVVEQTRLLTKQSGPGLVYPQHPTHLIHTCRWQSWYEIYGEGTCNIFG